MQRQQPTLKKPVRPVLLQIPGSPELTPGSGYAHLAQTRSRTAASPGFTGALTSPLTMTVKETTVSSHRHPRRAASLPPGRKRDRSQTQDGRYGSQQVHTKAGVGLASGKSSRNARQSSTAETMRGWSTERGPVAPSPEVMTSHISMRYLPGTGSYYGAGWFAPPASSPETLGM